MLKDQIVQYVKDANISMEGAAVFLQEQGAGNVSLGIGADQIAQNVQTLKRAAQYLDLYRLVDGQIVTDNLYLYQADTLKKGSVLNIHSDEMDSFDEGMAVLCAAFQKVKQKNDSVQADEIRTVIHSASVFYQQPVSEAYVSSCDAVLDAVDVPNDSPILKGLVFINRSLKKLHQNWPQNKSSFMLKDFWSAVEKFGHTVDIDVHFLPAKKCSAPHCFAGAVKNIERCA